MGPQGRAPVPRLTQIWDTSRLLLWRYLSNLRTEARPVKQQPQGAQRFRLPCLIQLFRNHPAPPTLKKLLLSCLIQRFGALFGFQPSATYSPFPSRSLLSHRLISAAPFGAGRLNSAFTSCSCDMNSATRADVRAGQSLMWVEPGWAGHLSSG